MKQDNNTRLDMEVDDEHPFFTAVWEQSKASRTGLPPALALTAELRIGDAVQTYHLDNVADLRWHEARAVMRTSWRAAGEPTRITTTQPATTTEEKSA